MITTKELYEWREKTLATYEKAVEESEKAESKEIEEYYLSNQMKSNGR